VSAAEGSDSSPAKQRGKIVRSCPFMPRGFRLHAAACMLRPPTPPAASRPPH
jgi:hypothetical protein